MERLSKEIEKQFIDSVREAEEKARKKFADDFAKRLKINKERKVFEVSFKDVEDFFGVKTETEDKGYDKLILGFVIGIIFTSIVIFILTQFKLFCSG